jgi:hypothetical protein
LLPSVVALVAGIAFVPVYVFGKPVFGGYHPRLFLDAFAYELLTFVFLGSNIALYGVPLCLCCAAGGTVALVRRFGWAEVRGLVALLWAVGALGVIVLGWGSSALLFLLGNLAFMPYT